MKISIGAARWRAAALVCAIALVAAPLVTRAFVSQAAQSASAAPANLAKNSPVQPVQTPAMRGFPYDWSHRHLIFSRPSSPAMAARLERDPRYRIQQAWRARQARSGSADEYMQALDALATQLVTGRAAPRVLIPKWGQPLPHHRLRGDWSVNMGSGAKVGAGRYPAKFSFNPIGAPNCTSDFVVFNTGLNGMSGVSGKASIIAYNNLYATTCPTPVPKTYWAYNTGGPITNSTVLSGDGSQVAFIHSGSPASLVILRPIAGEGSAALVTSAPSPDILCTSSGCTGGAASYLSCKTNNPGQSCQLTLTLNNMSTDSNSAPFYDYANDIIYVGDDVGLLHKFTGVFKASPAEVTVSPWPATMHANAILTSPVLDSSVNPPVVYVAVATGSAGILDYASTATPGTRTESAVLGFNSIDVADAPIVDSNAGKIYVAVGNDGSVRGSNSGVFVFGRGFNSSGTGMTGTSGIEAKVGVASTTPVPLYDGDFDNTYFSSSGGVGNFYVCGNTGGAPALYQVPITSNNIGSVQTGPSLASASTTCSPITEIYNSNGPFDWIFLSVRASGNVGIAAGGKACTGACVYSFNVTNGSIGTSTQAANGLTAAGGSSGIIIDNTSATTGASQIYFSTLSSGSCGGGCAVQASQSGLQ